EDLCAFVAELTALRRRCPALRQSFFLHASTRRDGVPDLRWRRADGGEMTPEDWQDPARSFLSFELRTAAETPDFAAAEDALFLVFNRGEACDVRLPEGRWERVFATDEPESDAAGAVASSSVAVFVERP
ncbi:MAG: glycogen debranching enzyme GlgX, partial [Pseudomonadota bacterium]